MASTAELQQKQTAYNDYLLTTHWPGMNIQTYERDQAVGKLSCSISNASQCTVVAVPQHTFDAFYALRMSCRVLRGEEL